MTRIPALSHAQADATTRAKLDAVKAKMGKVPNMVATFAHSPVALQAFLALNEAVGGGRLSAGQREIIALSVGQTNACQYCLSAHSTLAKGAGLTADDVRQARDAHAKDPRDAAIAQFARLLTDHRGVISDAEFAALQQQDIDAGLALEILVNVVMNILTNYTNHLADTEIDFPLVALENS